MVSRTIFPGKEKRRVNIIGTEKRRVDPEQVAKALGAEIVGDISENSGGSPVSKYARRQEIFRRLSSSEGQPTLEKAQPKQIIEETVPKTTLDISFLDEEDQKVVTVLALYLKERRLPREKRILPRENLINMRERIILSFSEPSLNVDRSSSLSTSLGTQIGQLIAHADLSKDEEERLANDLIEITKHRLERIKRKQQEIHMRDSKMSDKAAH